MYKNLSQQYNLFLLFVIIDNISLQMKDELSNAQESILNIERKTSLDHELIKSELIKAQENKSQEITNELKKEINAVQKRTDEVSLKVENSINKLEQVSSLKQNALITDLKKRMEMENVELTNKLDNSINTITKRIDTISSDLCASSTKLDKLMVFDHTNLTLEMSKLIEKKTQEVSNDLKSHINKETKTIQSDTVKEIQRLDQKSEKAQKLLDELNEEHQKLSKSISIVLLMYV